jgi:dTDP-4-dehydrorhamnose 3,5-epimerase
MDFQKCDVFGAWLIRPSPREDSRGRFMRAWCQREFADQGIDFTPVQANMSYSVQRGTIRGLHYQQEPALEAKLVRCTRGAIFDVVVDLRPDSPTYRAWYGTELSADNGRMLFVPEGCAHGCQTTEDMSELHYLTSAFYSPNDVRGLKYDDPAFGILWPLEMSAISDQDRCWPYFSPA